jgi:hypothetical protein
LMLSSQGHSRYFARARDPNVAAIDINETADRQILID